MIDAMVRQMQNNPKLATATIEEAWAEYEKKRNVTPLRPPGIRGKDEN
jgi:hypothetical protein